MFEKILHKFGYITKKKSLELRTENITLHDRIAELAAAYQAAKDELARERTTRVRPLVDTDTGDPAPEDSVARREYVMRVAAFHNDVLSTKIKAMIAEIRSELEKVDNSPDLDRMLKGTANALWLLHDWGELMVSEAMSYRADQKLLEEK